MSAAGTGDAPTGAAPEAGATGAARSDHVDVLIVGAGLSGVGAACHLRRECPTKSLLILEAREAIGGTWDLFRYPGVRSDSDMFTLGYSFRPWCGDKALADGSSILEYIRETAREHGVAERVRFGHRAVRAEWSSARARWTVHARDEQTGESVTITCSFLLCCTGYYRYDRGHTPRLDGAERFGGQIVHPQHWPAGLDCSGRRVVVIGSGATAVTLVPALAAGGADVTMLQRSPTYILSIPARDRVAARLHARLGARRAYAVVRWKNVLLATALFRLCTRAPALMRRVLRHLAARQLPAGFDVNTHLSPRYDPWDQRLCVVPDGDLFKALAAGRASIVTDRIEHLTENGLALASGAELHADVIVTATGLELLFLGGMEVAVDGARLDPADTLAYKGMMLAGVPNMAFMVGYTNASWTLKCDLVARYVCRLLTHMDRHRWAACIPQAPDPAQPTSPIVELQSGYVLRAVTSLPRQGARVPWRLHQSYIRDLRLLGRGPLDDAMRFVAHQTQQREPPAPRVAAAA